MGWVKRKTAAENVEYVLDEAHVLQEADAAIQEHPSYRRYHYGAEPVQVMDGGTGRFIGTAARSLQGTAPSPGSLPVPGYRRIIDTMGP